MLSHAHVVFPALSIFVSCMASAFFDPIMAKQLSTYEVLANKAGLVFCFFAFAFGAAGYITQYIPSARNKHLILTGMLIISAGFFLIAIS
jgi:hypothetical protein